MRARTFPFVMQTDWLFQGPMDFEYQEYKLLAYFQKMNKNIDEMKIYPMFTEISLHYGNIISLKEKNQIMYIDREIRFCEDEINMSELKFRPAPDMSKEDMLEYHRIIRYSAEKFEIYFMLIKALWTTASDGIETNQMNPSANNQSDIGFFYTEYESGLFVWKYEFYEYKQNYVKLIHTNYNKKMDVKKIVRNFTGAKDYGLYPVFEVVCKQDLPLEETIYPIAKRKIMSLLMQCRVPEKKLLLS